MTKEPTYRGQKLTGRCCGTCTHATFSITDRGNFRQDRAGRCGQEPQILAPACFEVTTWRRAIWPDGYPECPTWEQK